jgi:hypothetical protein
MQPHYYETTEAKRFYEISGLEKMCKDHEADVRNLEA